jgi:hypothetical protein
MNSDFYTSSGAQPQSLADEIMNRIRFGAHGVTMLDKFTLHRVSEDVTTRYRRQTKV